MFEAQKKVEAFEWADLRAALEVMAEKKLDSPLSNHRYLFKVIMSKREARLSREEKTAEADRQAGRRAEEREEEPLDPASLPGFLRGSAERHAGKEECAPPRSED